MSDEIKPSWKYEPIVTYTYHGVVTNIVDGDTIDVEIDVGFRHKTKQRLRLNRVNTPERNQPGWKEATDYTRAQVAGLAVRVQTELDDAFGRYLAEVFFERGGELLNLNNLLLETGHAVPYRRK